MRGQPIMALGVALLMAPALTIAGCGTSIGTISSSQNTYTITDPVTSLTINNLVGNTQIEATDATTVSVTEQLRYSGDPPRTRHVIIGGRLTLSYACPSGLINVGVHACSVTYVVMLPRRVAVQIDDTVGTVSLSGLAGQLTLTSSTGSINATGLTSSAVNARASAGVIFLAFTAPPASVDAQTQVGSITIRLPAQTVYAVDAKRQLGSAGVTVQQDADSAHRITAHSQVGSVTITNN